MFSMGSATSSSTPQISVVETFPYAFSLHPMGELCDIAADSAQNLASKVLWLLAEGPP